MKTIIEWLVTIEHSANEFYEEAADYFHEDKELITFLKHLAADEAEHYHVMASALQYVESRPPQKSQIEVDDTIKAKVEGTFRSASEHLHSGSLTINQLTDCIVESEFSEWNDIYDYAVNTLMSEDKIFAYPASRVEHHLRHIDRYLHSTDYGKNKLHTFRQLPYAKKERILIVDDEPAIAKLLSALFMDVCESDLAANGAEALEMIKSNIYSLVISDVDMPDMNGIELYNHAMSFFTKPNEMFVFHTGKLTDDRRIFFENNNLTYFEKPSSITKIKETVKGMFHVK